MKTLEAINAAIEQNSSGGTGYRLGASVIGDACARKVWYTWRWAKAQQLSARMRRLFDRGFREEIRFAAWLQNAGIHVQLHDPKTKKQFRVQAHEEHFGGALDAVLQNVPDWPDPNQYLVGEFKTHSDKSFNSLTKSGVAGGFWQYFVQDQIYMHLTGLPACLYCGINKNDDELYLELLPHNQEVAEEYLHRAAKIIAANEPPERINSNPSWWQCQMCPYQQICHYGAVLDVNCRTCRYARPVESGRWHCLNYNYPLSNENQRRGCLSHTPIANS